MTGNTMRHFRWVGAWSLVFLVACGADNGAAPGSANAEPAPGDAGTNAAVPVTVPVPSELTPAPLPYCAGDSDAIEQKITELLGVLSVEQKAGLMHGAGLDTLNGVWRVEGIAELGIAGFRMLDGPRGLSQISGKSGTVFPVAMLRGATWNPGLERSVGEAIARELWSAGADVLLAPTINLLRHPRWGRAQETYSEDPHHMAELAMAFVRGVQSQKVLASAKHYAVNSIENTRHSVSVDIDERTLREIYLPHFRRAVQEAQLASIMSAYNRVNGSYCDLNRHLLTDILKDDWAFQGFVESDWVLGTHGDADSVLAGLDLEMPTGANFGQLETRVLAGELDESELDDSVRRLLRAQFCYDLEREHPVDDVSARATPEHLALARRVARQGMVLLRNQGAALPLDEGLDLVVLGRVAEVENIGDTGSSAVLPAGHVVTALEGLQERFTSLTHIPQIEGKTSLSAAERATVSGADAVIFVTGSLAEDEGEATVGAGDRDSLQLPASEVALLTQVADLHERVIVVVEAGAAITMPWAENVEGIVFAFYPGQEGGRALADLLSGDASPRGRLPFSIPLSEADLPPFDNVSEKVTYGYLHGYRHLLSQGTPAQYPFGFGLGYGEVGYGPLTISGDRASSDGVLVAELEISNPGPRQMVETVQLYLTAIGSRVTRSPRELKAFAQVEVPAMDVTRVTLELPLRSLAFYDVDAGQWEVEAIEYEVRAAKHAEDPGVTAKLRVQ